jgi:hypothetical protein
MELRKGQHTKEAITAQASEGCGYETRIGRWRSVGGSNAFIGHYVVAPPFVPTSQ